MLSAASGLAATAITLTTRGRAQLAARLYQLPAHLGVVYLTRTERARAREAQALSIDRGGRPVITDDDAAAITITATVLTYLGRLRRPLTEARAVVLCPEAVPVMCGLLLAAGIPHVTTRGCGDTNGGLEDACRDADVVINLLGARPSVARLAMDRPSGSVIEPGADHEHLLALPGLCRAIAASPGPLLDVEAYHACARGLVNATPPGWSLPSLHNRVTTYQVAVAASRVLNPTYRP